MKDFMIFMAYEVPPFAVDQEVPSKKRSKVVKSGEARSKKGKRKVNGAGKPPPLDPTDFVKVTHLSRRSEVLHEGWRPVSLSKLDKASQIEVNRDLDRASSRKGYRMVRATHGACEGSWYYEATMTHLGDTGHVRLGWSTRQGEVQAPVGYDEFSFGYRDLEGTKVHKALREDYAEPFQEGDTIGCYISLGQGGRPFEKGISDVVFWRGQTWLKEADNPELPKPLSGSFVAFSKNGVWQGIAYRDLLEGTYYPAISMYTLPHQKEACSVSVNFGPEFKHSPKDSPESVEFDAIFRLAGEAPLLESPPGASGNENKEAVEAMGNEAKEGSSEAMVE